MQAPRHQQNSATTDIDTATALLAPCQQPPSYTAATRHPPAYATATYQPPPSQQHHEESQQPDAVTALLEQCQESAGTDSHEPPPSYETLQPFPASTAPASVTLSPATASAQYSIVSQPTAAATSGAGSSSANPNASSAVRVTAQYDYLSNWRTSTARPGASADDAGVVGRHRIASFIQDRYYRSRVVSTEYCVVMCSV